MKNYQVKLIGQDSAITVKAGDYYIKDGILTFVEDRHTNSPNVASFINWESVIEIS